MPEQTERAWDLLELELEVDVGLGFEPRPFGEVVGALVPPGRSFSV